MLGLFGSKRTKAQDEKATIGGDILAYDLVDWWLATFTREERAVIEARYQPFTVSIGGSGTPVSRLAAGPKTATSWDTAKFLFILSTWFDRHPEERYLGARIRAKALEITAAHPITGPGYVDGRHFTTFVEEVKDLKREKRYDEALQLLHRLQAAVDAHVAATGLQPAHWYKEQIGIVERAIAKRDKAKAVSSRKALS